VFSTARFSSARAPRPHTAAATRGRVHRVPSSKSARFAVIGLITVILVMSGFSLWASQTTAAAASSAATANRLASCYLEASHAASEEQALERRYRLTPSSEARAAHTDAQRELVAELSQVRAEGTASDRVHANAVLQTHDELVASAEALFAAVDRGDTALAAKIEYDQTEPLFRFQQGIDRGIAEHREAAVKQLALMSRVSDILAWGVPLVFLVGLGVAVMVSALVRRYRRDLETEREQAVHDSLHDSVTGLPNRQLLATRLQESVESSERVGLVLLDLDRFKEINDTLGHRCGDELLTRVGPRLAETVRVTDTVARLGGDEFAVLLPDVTSLDDVLAIVEKLRTAIELPIQIAGVDLSVEASMGVVVSGEHGDDAQSLLRRAEVAMYVAKERNRGVAVYDPSEDAHDPGRLALLTELRRAIDQRELVLHYQPKILLATGEVSGVEALVRWEHPQRGMVAPDRFIPLAEHTGLIGPLTRYVLDAALRQERRWLDEGHPLPIAVNLAARNLADPDLCDDVLGLLDKHGVPANLLCLELTESAITTEPEHALHLMTRLRAAGISLAVDDFGTGYTSLAQLKNLPITELKIDRTFVGTMTVERSNGLIVRAIVDLARNLGLTTVAEGVEDADTFTALASNGCAVAQGYHMSRPLPADAFDRWYAETRAVYDVA
jgi:diguanylate cyclase (GGDEF)-like protein